MKLRVVAVGTRMPAWVRDAWQEYAKRMPRESPLELVELKPESRAGLPTARVLEAERDRIRAALPGGCTLVALDERGASWDTRRLAQALGEWMASGADVAFAIGGADGLHPEIKAGASTLLSLSALTLPHALARVVLAEQLYRASSLLRNHPYHRD